MIFTPVVPTPILQEGIFGHFDSQCSQNDDQKKLDYPGFLYVAIYQLSNSRLRHDRNILAPLSQLATVSILLVEGETFTLQDQLSTLICW
jgi:hypothetical protein